MSFHQPYRAPIDGYTGPRYSAYYCRLNDLFARLPEEGHALKVLLERIGHKYYPSARVVLGYTTKDGYQCRAALFVLRADGYGAAITIPRNDRSVGLYSQGCEEDRQRLARRLMNEIQHHLSYAQA